jgi:hypothetical protein
LEHLLVQEQFGDEDLEALDLRLEFADPPALIHLGRVKT